MNHFQVVSIKLRVPNLARSVAFYSGKLGFSVVAQHAGHADLAVEKSSAAILTLLEDRTAQPAPRETAGLFHNALLLPNRAALGRWLRFAAEQHVDFDGFSDHAVSEAIYLTDPDGNGLEFYADRPRATWPFAANGEVAMTTQALDVESLLAEAKPTGDPVLRGARWGHLHLRVTNLARSEAFYRAALGLAVTQSSYPGARFLAVDGYHHHLGLNSWGAPSRPQPAGALGLAEATFTGSDFTADKRLSDPDGISVHLLASQQTAAV